MLVKTFAKSNTNQRSVLSWTGGNSDNVVLDDNDDYDDNDDHTRTVHNGRTYRKIISAE